MLHAEKIVLYTMYTNSYGLYAYSINVRNAEEIIKFRNIFHSSGVYEVDNAFFGFMGI